MFGRWCRKDGRADRDRGLRCSFCKKNQKDVRKLIAGPSVFICDECVQVCVDIIADDDRFERDVPAQSDDAARETSSLSATGACTLCRMPVVLEDTLIVEDRALLCQQCVSAIQDALTGRDRPTESPDIDP
jgi:hypothetical protein